MYSSFCPHHYYLCDKSWKKFFITAIFSPVHCSIKILLLLSIRNRFHLYPVIVSLFSFAVFLPSLFPCFFSYLLGWLLACLLPWFLSSFFASPLASLFPSLLPPFLLFSSCLPSFLASSPPCFFLLLLPCFPPFFLACLLPTFRAYISSFSRPPLSV